MSSLSKLREQYPEYNDLSDQQLADAYHKKYYADIPKEQYYSKIGFNSEQPSQKAQPSGWRGVGHDIYETFAEPLRHPIQSLLETVPELASEVYGLGKQAVSLPFEALQGQVPRLTKNVAQGFENFVNTPANIAGYLGRHGIGFPADVAERTHIKVNPFEMGEPEAGDVFAQGLPSIAALGPLGEVGQLGNVGRIAARAGAGGGMGITQNQNPITTALLNAGIPGVMKGGQKAYEYFREPKKALNESQEALQNIQHLLSEQRQAGEAEKTGVSQFMNQVQEGLTNRQQQLNSQLPELFPIEPQSLTRKNLNLATHDAVKNLDEDFNQRYNHFNTAFGNNPVHKPFEWHDINLDKLPHVSMTTRKMGYNASNDELKYETPEGKEVTIKFPAENSSIQEYVDFSRELRDAAYSMNRRAKNATHGDKMSLLTTRNRLLQLQGQAEQKIHDTIGDEPYQQYRAIQDDYSHLMGPVKNEPSFFNAAYGKKISKNFHDTLTQPLSEHFRNYLYQSPKFVKALRTHLMQGTKHPLTTGAMTNPAAIDADLQYLLSPQQRAAQAEQLQLHQAQEHLNQVSKHLKQSETLTPLQEQQVHQFNPKTSKYLSDEAQRQAIIRQLERQKSEQTMTKEERQRQLSRRNKIAATIGGAIALTQGHKITNLMKHLFK